MPPPVGTIVCPACAAGVPKNAKACPYCGAEVVLAAPRGADGPADRLTYCTRCGLLYPSAAATCPRCPPGSTDERGGRCPRCAGALEPTTVGPVTIDRCRGCKGTWFDGDELEHVVDLTTKGVAREEALALKRGLPEGSLESEVRYLACVRCGERMYRRQVAMRAGVLVDICRAHGVWFDGGELEQFEAFVRAGGLEVRRHDGIALTESRRKRAESGDRSADERRLHASHALDPADGAFLGLAALRFASRLFRNWPL